MGPGQLEQYVAGRYAHELQQTGYQPVCQEADTMLQEALDVMAALNQATQFLKQQAHRARLISD